MGLAGLGILVGLFISFGVTRFLSSHLYNVSAADPMIFVPVALVQGTISLLACYFPARPATSADPVIALRQE